ncbi:MAG: pyrimidine 5'-nucleotidase [Betaproteobacteria bacterium TMED82]|nr:MAG: pyrimidine 5'-nucleotidase [Betaproteobacteria bacterium TMED82]|tara:strand:- start:25946 stop:26653 length:708 start_codon:yes stop_codon:yes gene_type:complete
MEDRKEILVWLFDLDDTLHQASGPIMERINNRMSEYISDLLKVGRADADVIRKKYWNKYGTTSAGLVLEQKVNLQEFLEYSHNVDDLHSQINTKRGLKNRLRQLKGRKWVVTNSYSKYARVILTGCGLSTAFERVFAIENMKALGGLRPKPSLLFWEKIKRRFKFSKVRYVLVDDSLANLRTAKLAGFNTVWINFFQQKTHVKNFRPKPIFVDYKINNIFQFNNMGRKLEIFHTK